MNRWRTARSGWWTGALLAALLWLPLMGSLHQIVHGGSPLQAGVEAGRAEGVANPSLPARAEGVEAGDVRGAALIQAVAGVFSTHGSEADCRVFDQLSHGDLLIGVAAAALPALPVATCPSCRLPAPPDLASAVPTARGPPGLA